MSYICLKCESTVILDPTSVSEIFQSGDGSMKIPEAIKEEFALLKDEMIEQFRDFLPDPQKYKSDTHMICESCLHSLLLAVDKDIKAEEAKKSGFIAETKALEEDVQKTEKKLEELKINEEHEAKLREEMRLVNEREENQKKELEELGRLQTHCEESEEIYWEEALKFESKLFLLNEKKNTVNKQIKEVQHELDKLNRVNILNDIIHISTDHEVAKINDLQLGKMYTASGVNWTETNAALGQLVLLFAILEEKCREMKYEKIKMKPQGSFSEVVRVTHDKEEKYELVGPPKDELRFNSGLFTLLEAMTQIHHHLSTKLGNMVQGGLYDLPHQILGENIGGIPFKYHGSKLDKWTEVLKYFSLNCKHLIYLFSLYEKNSQIALKANSEA